MYSGESLVLAIDPDPVQGCNRVQEFDEIENYLCPVCNICSENRKFLFEVIELRYLYNV